MQWPRITAMFALVHGQLMWQDDGTFYLAGIADARELDGGRLVAFLFFWVATSTDRKSWTWSPGADAKKVFEVANWTVRDRDPELGLIDFRSEAGPVALLARWSPNAVPTADITNFPRYVVMVGASTLEAAMHAAMSLSASAGPSQILDFVTGETRTVARMKESGD